MKYRRIFIPGGVYFFTLVTWNRRPIFNYPLAVEQLRTAVNTVRNNHPFRIIAWVILPDHLHMIWQLPEDDSDFPTRWRLIKGHFTRALSINHRHPSSIAWDSNPDRKIWQGRYWEHWIRNDQDLANHIEYIHYNPVKHGLVDAPIKWKFSSFADYVKRGNYPKDWGSESPLNLPENIGRE